MAEEHLLIVTYDIADPRRWRAVFKLMHGYGEWQQLSVFQCRQPRMRQLEMVARLQAAISATEDHVLIIDVGPADNVQLRVQSLGKRGFDAIERAPVIV
jgi:CRISPR-associated protein Cas2